jgi:hypothetical protein
MAKNGRRAWTQSLIYPAKPWRPHQCVGRGEKVDGGFTFRHHERRSEIEGCYPLATLNSLVGSKIFH